MRAIFDDAVIEETRRTVKRGKTIRISAPYYSTDPWVAFGRIGVSMTLAGQVDRVAELVHRVSGERAEDPDGPAGAYEVRPIAPELICRFELVVTPTLVARKYDDDTARYVLEVQAPTIDPTQAAGIEAYQQQAELIERRAKRELPRLLAAKIVAAPVQERRLLVDPMDLEQLCLWPQKTASEERGMTHDELYDRVVGHAPTEESTVTIETGGRSVTVTGEQLERAADAIEAVMPELGRGRVRPIRRKAPAGA